MMPGLQVPSIPQYKFNRHKGACLESFQAIGLVKPTFFETQETSKMSSKVRSLKSQVKTHSFLDDIITSSSELYKDCDSDIAVGIH